MTWYTRLYNWVSDRDNGIPITASRMDAEFDGIATAPNSLHTALGSNEWVAESNTVQYVSATSFKVLGVNLSSTYHVGRRLKIVNNGGGTTTYATVTGVSFSTDTTVTVECDGAASLVSAVTAVSYGLVSFVNPSYLDPRTKVLATAAASQAITGGGGLTTMQLGVAAYDALSEFNSGTDTWTPTHSGFYVVTAQAAFTATAGAASTNLRLALVLNGIVGPAWWLSNGLAIANGDVHWNTVSYSGYIAAGTTVKAQFSSNVNGTMAQTNTGPSGPYLAVARIA